MWEAQCLQTHMKGGLHSSQHQGEFSPSGMHHLVQYWPSQHLFYDHAYNYIYENNSQLWTVHLIAKLLL